MVKHSIKQHLDPVTVCLSDELLKILCCTKIRINLVIVRCIIFML